jgi:capsular polysaccharide biosynthesis protein
MIDVENIFESININSMKDDFNTEVFNKKTKYITINNDKKFISFDMFKNIPQKKVDLSFVSDNIKCIMSLNDNYYHFMVEHVGYISSMIKIKPKIEFIFHVSFDINNCPPYINEFLNKLKQNGIKYCFINFDSNLEIEINNYYYGNTERRVSYPTSTYNFFQEDIINKNIKPFRKVFLSRKMIESSRMENMHRIKNHKELEDLFISLGFEIIYPELFSSFKDQINYFYETSILVSTTSAGLANLIFMQPKQTVIELFTPMPINETDYQFHFFHHLTATEKNHKYISVSNIEKNVESLKDILIQNKLFLKFINEDL